MPRKNKNVKHTPFQPKNAEANKTRYKNRISAEKAAEYQMLLKPGLELHVYQTTDGGWYLTSQSKSLDQHR